MAEAISGYSPKEFVIESLAGTKLDISNSVLSIDYFEDILDHSISVIAQVTSSYDIVSGLKIRGGENVYIDLETFSGNFTWKDGNKILRIYKISGYEATKMAVNFTLHLTTKEFIMNEETRCVRKYSGKISESVKTILTDVLQTDKFLDKNLEETANSYDFIGANKKPFKTLQWLSVKSLSKSAGAADPEPNGSHQEKSKGTCGFFFFENQEGYNFKSIDSLTSKLKLDEGSSDDKTIEKYSFNGKVIESKNVKNNLSIVDYAFDKNIDLRKALKGGMYQGKTIMYNAFSHDFTVYDYDLVSNLDTKKLGFDEVCIAKDIDPKFNTTISPKISFRISDHGTMANIGVDQSGREPTDIQKSSARYSLLLTQSLNILIPCNVNLKIGDVIYCEFPESNGGESKEIDKNISGYYLIRELRHHFSANQNTTSLKLMRDSYGVT